MARAAASHEYVVGRGLCAAAAASAARASAIGEQLGERGVQRRRVAGRARAAAAPDVAHLGQAADVAEHDRLAVSERGREHAGEAEALAALVGQHDDVGAREQRVLLLRR